MTFENAVIRGGAYEFAIVYAYTLHRAFEAYFTVRYTYKLLVKYALDTFTRNIELRTELIATAERRLVVECHLGHHEVIACSTHVSKAQSNREEKFVACMLQIVLVVGIVDNTLKVTFIVAYLHEELITVFFHR